MAHSKKKVFHFCAQSTVTDEECNSNRSNFEWLVKTVGLQSILDTIILANCFQRSLFFFDGCVYITNKSELGDREINDDCQREIQLYCAFGNDAISVMLNCQAVHISIYKLLPMPFLPFWTQFNKHEMHVHISDSFAFQYLSRNFSSLADSYPT